MLGISAAELCGKNTHPNWKDGSRQDCYDEEPQKRFVILSWKHCGSDLLCEALHGHPEITMHKQVFSPSDISTYHPQIFHSFPNQEYRWTVGTRDCSPVDFLNFLWTGKRATKNALIKPGSKAVGFESFPEHWLDDKKEQTWKHDILYNSTVKKIVLFRENELAVFFAMRRAELAEQEEARDTTSEGRKVIVDPSQFQAFITEYRDTFRRKYRWPDEKQGARITYELFMDEMKFLSNEKLDTFCITYEQMMEEDISSILPRLWNFLGVNNAVGVNDNLKKLAKQAKMDDNEDLSAVIDNYEELEYCFRYSDVLHFVRKREEHYREGVHDIEQALMEIDESTCRATWSLLLPICSRPKLSHGTNDHHRHVEDLIIDFDMSSQAKHEETCWKMLEGFITSLRDTSSKEQLKFTECIVGIDVDDPVYQNEAARKCIQALLPCKTVFVDIQPEIYGQGFKIWNVLAQKASHDFIVPVGDDVKLYDPGWQERMVRKFHSISKSENLPLGAACVSFSDIAFPGVCTFPALHRWHIQNFGSFLPDEFTNQGGDPYLFELYSRFNAAAIEVSCRVAIQIGGYGDPRYVKSNIDWEGQFLTSKIQTLSECLHHAKPEGICLDVVVPSYRVDNTEYLRYIALLRATVNIYIRFWLVVDNPRRDHLESVTKLADELNEAQLKIDGNYMVHVLHYGENRGAVYARNIGFNTSTADWVLFLDDDVIPDEVILDAYAGAIKRYPQAKVFVGVTELPKPCNLWTQMLCASNIGYFYDIAKWKIRPSFGVTANLMVCGCRHNPMIQFKDILTGGGEDTDFVFQFKEFYKLMSRQVVVGIPEARAKHPWWNDGRTCYQRIISWAWNDIWCITEWSEKSFLTFTNWIEYTAFVLPPLTLFLGNLHGGLMAGLGVTLLEHGLRANTYFARAKAVSRKGFLRSMLVALGAGSIFSVQEMTRAAALICKGPLYSFCRRLDWFDGEESSKVYQQRQSLYRFGLYTAITWAAFSWRSKKIN